LNILPHLSAILITGTDAPSFLQSQLSSNVADLGKRAQLSSWCAANGRILGLGWLFRVEHGFCWIVATDTADALIIGLSKYRLRAKISLIKFAGAVCGSRAAPLDALAQKFAIGLHDGRWLALVENPSNAAPDAEFLAQWLALDLSERIPWNGGNERFLPQMLGLERFDGLSLKKGCFPGQEVIARLHYKGELKRSLRLLRADRSLPEGNYICCDAPDEVSVIQVSGTLALAVLAKTVPTEFSVWLGDQAVRCLPIISN
jgi:tRNA-modifying protein YgfZ